MEREVIMDSRILLISIMLNTQYSNSGVDHIAGFLRWKGYSVDIAYFHNNNSFEEVKANITYDYDYYGFSVDIKNVDRCIALADLIKEKTGAKIWFGGAFVASCYRNIFEDCTGVDYVILGGGEEPLLHLLTHINDPEADKHPNIASRTALENKSYHENTLFDYPIAEDYFIRYPAARGFYTYCLQTKNNTCTGACSFCINWCLPRKKMDLHYRSTSSIVDEMVNMYNKYQICHFFFIDDDLLDPGTREGKNRIAELCKAIIETGMSITLTGYTKANVLLDCEEDEELLDLMYKAGFVSLFVGIESGCQKDLAIFRKIASVEDNKRSLKLLYKHKIKPEYEMIAFHPYATLESLRENFKFLQEVHSYNFRHYSITGVSIYQNTVLWSEAARDGLLLDGYSYKEPDMYRYMDPDVERLAEFVKSHFEDNWEIGKLITADRLVTYYYRFSRYSKSVEDMKDAIDKITCQSYELLSDYFAPLYLDNDMGMCERRYSEFIKEYKNQGEQIQKLVNKMLKYSILQAK